MKGSDYKYKIIFWSVMIFSFLNEGKMSAQVYITSSPDVILTQHWAMPTLLDPASTGNTDFIRIRGGARLDYLGSDASPKHFLVTADSPFKLPGKKIGAGILVNNQTYDLFNNLQVSAQGSYKLQIKKSVLSIGVQIGYYHSKFKGSEMKFTNNGPTEPDYPSEGDPGEFEGRFFYSRDDSPDGEIDNGETESPFDSEYPTHDVGAGTFDLGLAVNFNHPKFYVGISVLHLTNTTLRLKKEEEGNSGSQFIFSKLPMTLYFGTGGNIAINNSLFTLQPSLLLGSDFKDFNGVAEMRATYNQKVTFGLDYRYNRAAGLFAGLTIKNFYIGYSWEYDYKSHPRGSTGNHELVLGYQLKLENDKKSNFSHRSIRLM